MHKIVRWFLALCVIVLLPALEACKETTNITVRNFNYDSAAAAAAITVVTITQAPTTGSWGAGCAPIGLTYQFTATTNKNSVPNATEYEWSSSNEGVAKIDASGKVTIVPNAVGTTTITAKSKLNPKISGTTTITLTNTACTSGPATLTFTPHGGSFAVGQTVLLAVQCTNIACTGPGLTVSSSNNAIISVPNPSTSNIVCLAAGTARVTVQMTSGGVTASDAADFTCTAVPNTLTLNQTGPITLRTGANCAPATLTLSTVGNVLANWTSSNTGLLPFTSSNASVAQVTLLGTAGQSGTSTVTANGVAGGTASIVVNLDNTACATSGNLASSLPLLSVSNCAGLVTAYTPNITNNSQPVTGTWTSSNTAVAQINSAGNGFNLTGAAGSASITVTVANVGSIVIPVTVNPCPPAGTFTANPSSVTITNCSGFTAVYTPVLTSNSNQTLTGTWTFTTTSSGGSIGTATSNGFTLNGVVGTGTASVSVAGFANPVTIPVTVNACPSNGTVVVTPNPLNLTLGNPGNLTATLSGFTGTAPTITWTATLGCVLLQSTTGATVTVNTPTVCRDSVVATAGGAKGYSIVNVTSGASSCTWSNANNSTVYNQYTVGTAFNAVGSCVYQGQPQQPYWYSKDPSRFTVQGAPFVCVIAGVAYPCGTSATIKPIAAGTTEICDQAAVQDPTVFFCRTVSTTGSAPATGNKIATDTPQAYELILPTAPPKGARVDRVYTWAEWVNMHK